MKVRRKYNSYEAVQFTEEMALRKVPLPLDVYTEGDTFIVYSCWGHWKSWIDIGDWILTTQEEGSHVCPSGVFEKIYEPIEEKLEMKDE
jgi:hypothetical protein